MELNDVYPLTLLALCVWREARGETSEARTAVACSIRNRVLSPKWWGDSYETVVLKPYQYSSFNANDPNAVKLPHSTDKPNWDAWQDCLQIAFGVWSGATADITSGADSYFDKSLDAHPPTWALDARSVKTCDIGRLHFYKTN